MATIVATGVTTGAAASATQGALPAVSGPAAGQAAHATNVRQACATPTAAKTMRCFALIRTDVAHHAGISPNVTPAGYGPAQFQSAYNLASAAATGGSGQTVYIVDVFDDPNAQADLNTYRSQYGLPACGSGCFTKVNQNGATSPLPSAAGTSGWDVEESLDFDMVSAICPNCHITLVEATSASGTDLYTAENSAVSLGAKFVTNSWGGGEYSGESTDANNFFNHPGVAITVSAGDSPGPEFPAEATDVTAVGGTTLSTSSNSRGWTESPWSSSGGGCSRFDAAPSWESSSVTGCGNREDNDVSADADPNTGAAIYDTYSQGGWLEVGGTSESSPIIASVYALAGAPASGTYPAQYIWAHEPNGLFAVGSGYSSIPGWGTPNGTSAFASGGGTTGNTVTVTNPGSQSTVTGTAVSLQIQASDSASGQTLTYSATGLPTGLSISSSTGLISGTPTTVGTFGVQVTATDTTGASGPANFTWSVTNSGGGGSGAIVNGGFESGSTSGWTVSGSASVTSNAPHTGGFAGLAGLFNGVTSTTSSLSQTFTAPAGSSRVSLWYNVACHDTVTFDWARVTLTNTTTGRITTILPRTCNLNGTWAQVSASIVAGNSYTISLQNHDDGFAGDPTWTEYDDVATS
jgi:hypothetical protein